MKLVTTYYVNEDKEISTIFFCIKKGPSWYKYLIQHHSGVEFNNINFKKMGQDLLEKNNYIL